MPYYIQCIIFWIGAMQLCICQKIDRKVTSFTNLDQCKITHSGVDYQGTVSTTVNGVQCQSWSGENQLYKVGLTIKDTDFLDGNKKLAKNFCRNPTLDAHGLWCYITDINLQNDTCNVSLCNYGNCRISGTGAEYGGQRNFTYSRKFCLPWDYSSKSDDNETGIFEDDKFPDKSRMNAQNFCRNPTDDNGGPWCYVENEEYNRIVKEYCDIPFCDDKDYLVFTRQTANYSTITKMNSSVGSMTVWIKLWNPLDTKQAGARLLLSHLPIPTSAKKIAQDWGAGAELVFSNFGSGLYYPNFEENIIFDYTPHILVGTKWTGLTIIWIAGVITVSYYGSSKPLFMGDYGSNNSYASSLYPDGFLYYGLMANGAGLLWSIELSQQTCEVHTTFGIDFGRLWPMHKKTINYNIQFSLRADRNAVVKLYQSPGVMFPCFTLAMGYPNTITLMYQKAANSSLEHIKDVTNPKSFDYYTWIEFYINIFESSFRLSHARYDKKELMYIRHDLFTSMRWFSVGSENVIAHWTLFCSTDVSDTVEFLSPPNCVTSPTDFTYSGDQWVTKYHKPCIPWPSQDVPENEKNDNRFPDGSALKALNRCRNPTKDPKGLYCYSIRTPESLEIRKEYCEIHLCKSSECRIAGTGNDYIGKLSTTRSGRSCVPWVNVTLKSNYIHHRRRLNYVHSSKNDDENDKKEQMDSQFIQINTNYSIYLNDSLYPERSVKKASNFCRDPSRSIAGPWCFTTDPLVLQDLCNVRDCDKDEQCIFLVRGSGFKRRQYILPEHRINGLHVDLKLWEPDHPDNITFIFMANDNLRSRYILRLSGIDNEQVFLFYIDEADNLTLVMRKALPHLLYMGMWTNFVIRIPRGKVELYYAGASTPIFEWTHPNSLDAFIPIYYTYNSDYGHTVGVAFDCASQCTVEMTETKELTRILPVTIRSKRESNLHELVLTIRAKGIVLVPLLLFPESIEYYGFELDERSKWISFIKKTNSNTLILQKQPSPFGDLFTENEWKKFIITWEHDTIHLRIDTTIVFHYKHSHPLLFYFFTVIVGDGSKAIWTANCNPLDIDELPEDGGWSNWSPWTCSVSCNGGIGRRERICNNPPPNIKGEPCMGPNTMIGRCNTIICGDITDDTIEIIEKKLRNTNLALSVEEGQSITIMSHTDLISRIIQEAPNAELKWAHNGIFINIENRRIITENYNMVINFTEVNDSGVYTNVVHRINGTNTIIRVVSLAVYPKSAIVRRETQSMILTCNCVTLGYLYDNLRIMWLINGKIWKNYGMISPKSINIDHIQAIDFSLQGLWECVVKQDDLNFHWITNVMKIKIINAPNWKTYLIQDEFTKPIFSLMPSENAAGLFFIIILTCLIFKIILIIICCIKLKNYLKKTKSKYNRIESEQREEIRKPFIQSENEN